MTENDLKEMGVRGLERRGRKGSASARSEEMERVCDR
jgi:hypothetical protein